MAVTPSLIEPVELTISLSILKVFVLGEALFETKVRLPVTLWLVINSIIASCPIFTLLTCISGTSATNLMGSRSIIVAQICPLSKKFPGLTIDSMYPLNGAFTSVLLSSTTPRLHSNASCSTKSPCLAPIWTTSPVVFALTSTLLSDILLAFNLIEGWK